MQDGLTRVKHSLDVRHVDARTFEIIHAVREGSGVSSSVWGVEQFGNGIAWEFYFHDYRRRERQRSITTLLDIVSPFLRCEIAVNENLFYFMFAVDIDHRLNSEAKDLDEILS